LHPLKSNAFHGALLRQLNAHSVSSSKLSSATES
jgi:hypothetical protein